MNVKQMIRLMRTLGIGSVFSDEETDRIALEYLNLANDEIYSETANLNSDILINDTLTNNSNEDFVTLTNPAFSLAAVFPIGQNFPLKILSALDFAIYKFQNPINGVPLICFKKGKTVSIYPIQNGATYSFSIWYPPERIELTLDTPEVDIPYPSVFHSVVVDCALYYLFQDEGGFKNAEKENQALRRYIEKKNNLISYFQSANRQSINTFSNA